MKLLKQSVWKHRSVEVMNVTALSKTGLYLQSVIDHLFQDMLSFLMTKKCIQFILMFCKDLSFGQVYC